MRSQLVGCQWVSKTQNTGISAPSSRVRIAPPRGAVRQSADSLRHHPKRLVCSRRRSRHRHATCPASSVARIFISQTPGCPAQTTTPKVALPTPAREASPRALSRTRSRSSRGSACRMRRTCFQGRTSLRTRLTSCPFERDADPFSIMNVNAKIRFGGPKSG